MRILWLKTELLHPVDKGGRIRTYEMLRALARDHEITYLCLDDGTAAPDAAERAYEYAHDVVTVPFQVATRGTPRFFAELARNVASSLPYALARYRSAAFQRELVRLATPDRCDVVVCDFLAPAVNLPASLPVPVVLFQHNVEAEIWRRHAEVRTGTLAGRYFAEQWRRMRRYERDVCRRVEHVVAVSVQDREHFEREYGAERVSDVPTGVDVDYFRPSGTEQRRPGNLVFTGSMDWMPNEDGIRWFVEHVLPLIHAEAPGTTLTVVGRNPPASIRALGERDPEAIEVTGRVPDVRPYLERGAVFVVPLRVGGGTRLKIYEGMAMELPVVSTTIGAEGLPVRDGEHICLGDDPESFARLCVSLLRDRNGARQLGQTAAGYVRTNFGWDAVAQRFAASCEAVTGGSVAPRAAGSALQSMHGER